jgi:hypothetical protein
MNPGWPEVVPVEQCIVANAAEYGRWLDNEGRFAHVDAVMPTQGGLVVFYHFSQAT